LIAPRRIAVIGGGVGGLTARHDPGHAQVDFGEALAEIAGVERKIHFFAMDLPHSDACFVQAYPAETGEAFCDGHNAAFDSRKRIRHAPAG
jgi:transposase